MTRSFSKNQFPVRPVGSSGAVKSTAFRFDRDLRQQGKEAPLLPCSVRWKCASVLASLATQSTKLSVIRSPQTQASPPSL
jgi:hypothetical protein